MIMMNQVDRRRSDFEHEFNKRVQTEKNRKYLKKKTFEKNVQPYLVVPDDNVQEQHSNSLEIQTKFVSALFIIIGISSVLLILVNIF